jgi:hypothetical protein
MKLPLNFMHFYRFIALLIAAIGSTKTNKAVAQNTEHGSTLLIVLLQERPAANYEFSQNWTYKPHIYRLKNGQLRCSVCPADALPLVEKNGKVKKKNLAAYYSVIDTAHLLQTMQSETDIPGFVQPRFTIGKRTSETDYSLSDSIGKGSTFSWQVSGQRIKAEITLSNPDGNTRTYKASSGGMQLSLSGWVGGKMEGLFDFVFTNVSNPDDKLYWKGVLHCPIMD